MGCVKSTVCQWLRKAPLTAPELPPDGVLELDGLWTRTSRGHTELKVIRDTAAGMVLGAFGSWTEVIDRAWQQGAQHPQHLVSDGDGAIAVGIEPLYGGEAPHQLCAFYLLREYRRNIGVAGFAAARGCWTRAVWRKVGNGRGGLCARRLGRRVTGVRNRCPRDCATWRREGVASDDVAIGVAQSGVAAAGEAGDGVDGAQPAGVAARARADQPNHLKRNATPASRVPTLGWLLATAGGSG